MLPDTSQNTSGHVARCQRAIVAMSTTVTVEVLLPREADRAAAEQAIDRALAWFGVVEATCSRFVDTSELRQLSAHVGDAMPASPLLCQAVDLALAVARETGGAFDPTIGGLLAERGFDRAHHSGERVAYDRPDAGATFRDVSVDLDRHEITLHRPLVLDLGALAKGLAIDLAARELEPFQNFAVSAGGDLFFGGLNASAEPWAVGIRHPRQDGAIVETVRVTDAAVCTSGDYERRQPGAEASHHLIDPRTGEAVTGLASVTVRAPTAVAADILATAAFVLGADEGLAFLEREAAAGLFFTPALDRLATASW